MTEIQKLLDIMRALRDPETGCPWDRQQTFNTIAPYTIEEAYEVADAIETGDMDELRSELGDLLLQVVYHAQMADEENHFNFTDVVACINKKLIDRHPHVFGSVKIATAEVQSNHWESIKVDERKIKADSKHNQTIGSLLK
jgi:MazG family protein